VVFLFGNTLCENVTRGIQRLKLIQKIVHFCSVSIEITKADNALELDGKVTELSFKNSISHSLSEAGFSLSSMANLLELYCEKTSNFIAKTKQKARQI